MADTPFPTNPAAALNLSCIRALNDKIYEKRKSAAVEVERMCREFATINNTDEIENILGTLGESFAISANVNVRKGGLIGLAAAAIGLGSRATEYKDKIVPPILISLSDTDHTVRYFACESLYNVIKVIRSDILPLFNDIYASLATIVCDTDQNIRSGGGELVDRLLKDIVCETAHFDIHSFAALLRDRLYSPNAFVRKFHLSWIDTLYRLPNRSNLFHYLPDFLDALFIILGDANEDIRIACEFTLSNFLNIFEVTQGFGRMVNIVVGHAQSSQQLIQLISLRWLHTFVSIKPSSEGAIDILIPFSSGILVAILPNLSLGLCEIRSISAMVNDKLLRIVIQGTSGDSEVDFDPILEVLIGYLLKGKLGTQLASLQWLYNLLEVLFQVKDEKSIQEKLLFSLLNLLSVDTSNSDRLIMAILRVISAICQQERNHFTYFVTKLLDFFRSNVGLLENRGSFIIQQLCTLLDPNDIYQTFSEHLCSETEISFVRRIVQILSHLLMTSPVLSNLRHRLRHIKKQDKEDELNFFCILFRSWCANSVSVISLCLLAGFYGPAGELIHSLGEFEISLEILLQLDRFIQLIESPVFVKMRLDLLEPESQPELLYVLHAVLMLLPQTETFKTLKSRLDCIASSCIKRSIDVSFSSIDFNQLLMHFKSVQENFRKNSQIKTELQINNDDLEIFALSAD